MCSSKPKPPKPPKPAPVQPPIAPPVAPEVKVGATETGTTKRKKISRSDLKSSSGSPSSSGLGV